MTSTTLDGSPARDGVSTVDDLVRFAAEVQAPRLLDPRTVLEAQSVVHPGLKGVLPGYGHQSPNDWGLGFEIRDSKSPHWTGDSSSPATFGHFGQSGTFLWIDPGRGRRLRHADGPRLRPVGGGGVDPCSRTRSWPSCPEPAAARLRRRQALEPDGLPAAVPPFDDVPVVGDSVD